MWDTGSVCQGQSELGAGHTKQMKCVCVCGVIDPVFMHHIDLVHCGILSILFI